MKAKLLFLLLTAAFISCAYDPRPLETDNPSPEPPPPPATELAAPQNVRVVYYYTAESIKAYVEWDPVPGARDYRAFCGTKPHDYQYAATPNFYGALFLHTTAWLEPGKTYYFALQSRNEVAESALSEPVSAITPYSPPYNWRLPDREEPFNREVFMAEKAAWEAQGIRHYRFIANCSASTPEPFYLVTVSPEKAPEAIDLNKYTRPEWWLRADELPERIFSPLNGKTIDEIYASIAEETSDLAEHSARIQYNKEYHYPERFSKFRVYDDPVPIGCGGLEFALTEFEVLDEAE
jgi:hypothetical protein